MQWSQDTVSPKDKEMTPFILTRAPLWFDIELGIGIVRTQQLQENFLAWTFRKRCTEHCWGEWVTGLFAVIEPSPAAWINILLAVKLAVWNGIDVAPLSWIHIRKWILDVRLRCSPGHWEAEPSDVFLSFQYFVVCRWDLCPHVKSVPVGVLIVSSPGWRGIVEGHDGGEAAWLVGRFWNHCFGVGIRTLALSDTSRDLVILLLTEDRDNERPALDNGVADNLVFRMYTCWVTLNGLDLELELPPAVFQFLKVSHPRGC